MQFNVAKTAPFQQQKLKSRVSRGQQLRQIQTADIIQGLPSHVTITNHRGKVNPFYDIKGTRPLVFTESFLLQVAEVENW